MRGDGVDLRDAERSAAVRWYVRLSSGDCTERDRSAFRAWLNAKPESQAAFDELSALLARVDRLRGDVLEQERSGAPAGGRSRSAGVLALAATLFLALLGGWYWTGPRSAVREVYTAVGQQESVALADGSVLHMNAVSRATIEFDAHTRRVRLATGEALFRVAADAERPFIVEVRSLSLRAVGTEFNVRVRGPETVVTVLEGAVRVSAGEPARELLLLVAGRQMRLQVDGTASVTDVDPSIVTAWRRGYLTYRGVPLGIVLEDVSAYIAEGRLEADPEIAGLRVSGTLRLEGLPDGDPRSRIRAMAIALGLTVEEREPRIWRFARQASTLPES